MEYTLSVIFSGLQAISDFTSNTLSALYFSIAKDSLYSDLRTSGRRSAILHVFRSVCDPERLEERRPDQDGRL